YRLIAQTDIKGAKFNSTRLQADLLKNQREDGGWSQAPEMVSDAYATGQTLYALTVSRARAGDAVVRAESFLLSQQQADGSWPMTSRPFGPEGKIAKDLRPIAFYGTAWATASLLAQFPIKE